MIDPTAQQMAALCARAYNDPPTFGAANSAGRAHLYGADVVFRGTDNPASMLADGDILTADTPLGKLHEGFWQAWLPIEAPLLGRKPQRIAGHSEGAALAVIYAGMLCHIGKAPSIVYCFEPPRLCMDDTLRQVLEKAGVTVWATCNVIDPVPWVPPLMSFPGELAHIGKFDPAHFDPIWYHLIANVQSALA